MMLRCQKCIKAQWMCCLKKCLFRWTYNFCLAVAADYKDMYVMELTNSSSLEFLRCEKSIAKKYHKM